MAAEPFVARTRHWWWQLCLSLWQSLQPTGAKSRSPPGSAQVECVGLSATPGFLTSAMRVLLALLGGAPLVFVGFEVMRPHPAAQVPRNEATEARTYLGRCHRCRRDGRVGISRPVFFRLLTGGPLLGR